MNEQKKIDSTVMAVRAEPGVPLIRNVNWAGMRALYIKEVRRFFKVQLQTIWAPAITTLLYLIIFTVALGRGGNMVLGVPFADFIAPGLIIMGMMQNSFANSSFSLLSGKIQGTLIDYLMPPLSVPPSPARFAWALRYGAQCCSGRACMLRLFMVGRSCGSDCWDRRFLAFWAC
jgi:ABC-2 type transport system permease protein